MLYASARGPIDRNPYTGSDDTCSYRPLRAPGNAPLLHMLGKPARSELTGEHCQTPVAGCTVPLAPAHRPYSTSLGASGLERPPASRGTKPLASHFPASGA